MTGHNGETGDLLQHIIDAGSLVPVRVRTIKYFVTLHRGAGHNKSVVSLMKYFSRRVVVVGERRRWSWKSQMFRSDSVVVASVN